MNFSKMTDAEIADLIRHASAELVERLTKPTIDRAADPRPRITMREPSEDDKDFVLRLKTHVMNGGYVTAVERERVAGMAEDYGSWIRMQGLPTSRGTGAWRSLQQYAKVKPARER